MRRIFWGVLGLLLCCVNAAPLLAAADQQQIVVHATVAPARWIIVSPQQPSRLQRVLSNTAQAVTPEVHVGSVDGPVLPLSANLMTQYDAVVQAHGGLGVGEFGTVAPVSQLQVRKDVSQNDQIVRARLFSASADFTLRLFTLTF